jgi:REP element-mobilizing transposase RayT
MQVQPRYTSNLCSAAYQLNWSLSVFGRESLPSPAIAMKALREALQKDQLKILEFNHNPPNIVQFFVSSQPNANPSDIVRLIKGRWQYLMRTREPLEFRRNYRITSVGTANANVLNSYVNRQPDRHPMADQRVQELIESLQFHDAQVDLTTVRRSSHGEFRYALQVVIESESGWHDVRPSVQAAYRQAIVASCRKHGWLLSRIGLLSNHIHILVGPGIEESPMDVALVLMNNMVFTQGMKPMFRSSFYAGTFGEYNLGAIWHGLTGKTPLPPGQAGRRA